MQGFFVIRCYGKNNTAITFRETPFVSEINRDSLFSRFHPIAFITKVVEISCGLHGLCFLFMFLPGSDSLLWGRLAECNETQQEMKAAQFT